MEMLNTPKAMTFTGNVADNWKRFKQRFELYRLASGAHIKDDNMQVPLLLHVMGDEALEVYNSFSFDTEAAKNKYETVIEKFEEFCTPKKNVILERFYFNKASQETNEDFDHFVTRVKNLASTCEFSTLLNSLIRDRIVVGVKSDGVRERMLRDKDLTLDRAIEMCKTAEVTKKHMQQLKEESTKEESTGEVREIRHKQMGKKYRNSSSMRSNTYASKPLDKKEETLNNTEHWCQRCGRKHASGRCPAYGRTCAKCKKPNHFAECCKTRKIDNLSLEEYDEDQVQPEEIEEKDLWFDSIMIEHIKKNGNHKDWICPIIINDAIVPMKLDTGAQANVLSWEDFKNIKANLHEHSETLLGYTGDKLNILGKCLVKVQYKDITCRRVFYVCKGPQHSLLGRELCEKLQLVKLTCEIDAVNEEQSPMNYTQLIEEFKEVFDGLGNIPGEYRIEIDDKVPPVVHPCRKIPFPMHEKLKEEIQRMEELGVISKVNEPTDWVSSIVIVPKPNGKLCVWLDPRSLDEAIRRQHFKLPSREEVMAKFANARVFTKLDASQGFWQMKLDEESSKLTTFNTPFGRYKYNRLPYGIKSAPEVYHKKVKEMFEGIPQVDTSMDDIIIHGENSQVHDEALREVFKRIKANNLKLNRDKCQFGVNQLIFLGDMLTDQGVKPDPRKV